jgi:hypothetical protein
MRSILHRSVLAPAVIVAAALTTTSLMAETTIVKVPFSFTVQGKAFPAGVYAIRHDDRANFVTLAAKGSEQSFSAILLPGEPSPTETKISLKFDTVGETHLLQSIQCGPMITSRLDKNAVLKERASLQGAGGR